MLVLLSMVDFTHTMVMLILTKIFAVIFSPFLISFVMFVIGYVWYKTPKGTLFNTPEIPGWLPFYGHVMELMPLNESYAKFETWVRDYSGAIPGIAEANQFFSRILIISNKEAIEEVFKQRPYKVQRDADFAELFYPFGEGLVSTEGKQWHRQRKIIAQYFSERKLKSYVPIAKKGCDRLVNYFMNAYNTNREDGTFDVMPTFANYTCDVVCGVGFGNDPNFIENKYEKQDGGLAKALTEFLRFVMRHWVSPFSYWKYKPLLEYMGEAETLNIIKANFASAFKSATDDPNCILHGLIKNKGISHKECLDNLFVLFAAGTDTTMNALTWSMYILGRKPELQARLRKEVEENCENGDLSSIRQVELGRAFFSEILRCYTPAPHMGLENPDEEITLMGKTVPKGTKLLIMMNHAMHTECGEVIGKPVFDVNHYLDDEGKYQKIQPDWLFGDPNSRGCVAARLARHEAIAAISKLLYNFDISLAENHPEVKNQTTLTLSPDKPVHVKFTPIERN
jgi:cytochrome P450